MRHGNLGTSLNAYPASVGSLIRAALPWTLGLVGTATVISFVLGTLIGVAAAWYEYSTRDYTGWPTASNPYIDPVPNAPYMEYTLLHLTPAS
jgi:peptide/nickel transport system permease protein